MDERDETVEMEETAQGEADQSAQESPNQALKEAEDRYLRLRADFENYKRRVARERQQQMELAAEGLAKSLLPVLDNFERAMANAQEGTPLLQGLEMVRRQFLEALEGAGVRVIESVGTTFDPDFHEAVGSIPSDLPAGTVVNEFVRGYLMGQRVIRPAMVQVAQESEGGETNE